MLSDSKSITTPELICPQCCKAFKIDEVIFSRYPYVSLSPDCSLGYRGLGGYNNEL